MKGVNAGRERRENAQEIAVIRDVQEMTEGMTDALKTVAGLIRTVATIVG